MTLTGHPLGGHLLGGIRSLVIRSVVIRAVVVRRLVSWTMPVSAVLRSARGKTSLLSAALAATAVALSVRSVGQHSGQVIERPELVLALTVTFFLTEQYMVNVEFRRESHSMTFSGVPLVVGVLILPVHESHPGPVCVGSLIALILQRVSAEKIVYNTAAFCFEAGLTATAWQLAWARRTVERAGPRCSWSAW